MHEIARLQQKLECLFEARNYLLNLQPTDMVAVSEITERIVAVTARLTAEISNPNDQQLSDANIAALTQAMDALRKSIQRSEAVSQIIKHVKALVER